jgi:hypothetical protein
VSDRQPVSRENLDAFAQVSGEDQLGHVDVECCPSTIA